MSKSLRHSISEKSSMAARLIEYCHTDTGWRNVGGGLLLAVTLLMLVTAFTAVMAAQRAARAEKALSAVHGQTAGIISCINRIHPEGGETYSVVFDAHAGIGVRIDPKFPIPDEFKKKDVCGHFIVVWRKEMVGTTPYIVWASKLKEYP